MNSKKTVFVTQIPHKIDRATGSFTPTVNIAPAGEFGEIKVMFPPRAAYIDSQELVSGLSAYLLKYDFELGDSIITLGDPLIIGATCAYLGRAVGKFTLLKWDRNTGRYLPTTVDVGGDQA